MLKRWGRRTPLTNSPYFHAESGRDAQIYITLNYSFRKAQLSEVNTIRTKLPGQEWLDNLESWRPTAMLHIHVGIYLNFSSSPYTQDQLMNQHKSASNANKMLPTAGRGKLRAKNTAHFRRIGHTVLARCAVVLLALDLHYCWNLFMGATVKLQMFCSGENCEKNILSWVSSGSFCQTLWNLFSCCCRILWQ